SAPVKSDLWNAPNAWCSSSSELFSTAWRRCSGSLRCSRRSPSFTACTTRGSKPNARKSLPAEPPDVSRCRLATPAALESWARANARVEGPSVPRSRPELRNSPHCCPLLRSWVFLRRAQSQTTNCPLITIALLLALIATAFTHREKCGMPCSRATDIPADAKQQEQCG